MKQKSIERTGHTFPDHLLDKEIILLNIHNDDIVETEG